MNFFLQAFFRIFCTQKLKFIILFIDSHGIFFTYGCFWGLFFGGSLELMFFISDDFYYQKVCLRENGREIDASDLLFLKFSHAPTT